MPSINKCLVVLTLALSAVAANHGQHMARGNHYDIARAPVPAPQVAPITGNVQKRAGSNSKRCKARSSSSTPSSTSSSSHSTEHSSTHSTEHSTSTEKTTSAEPTTSKKPEVEAAPTTTSKSSSKYTPPPATSAKSTPTTTSKAASSTSGSILSGLITGGIATFFTQNGVAGACGKVHPDSAMICALQTSLYANGANCGKQVEITNQKTGKTVTVTVADECPTCDNSKSIDLSTAAFLATGATVDDGIFPLAFKLL